MGADLTAHIIIGLDPGVMTGYAEWDRVDERLLSVRSMPIHEAFNRVQVLWESSKLHSVIFEDARLRKWYGEKGIEALQGAGSIKRDCGAWADFLGAHGIPYRAIAPQRGLTKWTSEQFRSTTGWAERTNEHARDAAMLVYGRTN